MRCFITGASGQLGSALVRALHEGGHELTALVVANDPWADAAFAGIDVTRVVGDILRPDSFPDERFDWVFHLAADQSFWRGHARRQRALNVDGVRNVVTWARSHPPQRFVHVSSLLAVGVSERPDHWLNEDSPFNGGELGLMYARNKRAGEQIVLEAAAEGLAAVVANPGTVLGPWDRGRHAARLLDGLVRGALRGTPGGGINVVDTRDAAVGLIAAARLGRVGQRYLLTGHNVTYAQLAASVCRTAGVGPPRLRYPGWALRLIASVLDPVGRISRRPPRVTPDDVTVGTRYLYCDSGKAHRELGFSVRELDETLTDTIRWYQASGVWT